MARMRVSGGGVRAHSATPAMARSIQFLVLASSPRWNHWAEIGEAGTFSARLMALYGPANREAVLSPKKK